MPYDVIGETDEVNTVMPKIHMAITSYDANIFVS